MFRKFDEDSQTLLEIKIRILHQIKCLEDPKYKINYILDDNPKNIYHLLLLFMKIILI